jgi:hypothetical protein
MQHCHIVVLAGLLTAFSHVLRAHMVHTIEECGERRACPD